MRWSYNLRSRQHYLISFQYFLYYNILYKRSISKQRYSVMAGSVTENVDKLSFASERMQAAERAHNFLVYFSLQTTSTVVEVSRCRSPFRSPPIRFMHRTLTPMRCWTVAVHSSISVSVSVDHPCCRKPHGSLRSFSLTGTIFKSIFSHSVEQITVLHKY